MARYYIGVVHFQILKESIMKTTRREGVVAREKWSAVSLFFRPLCKESTMRTSNEDDFVCEMKRAVSEFFHPHKASSVTAVARAMISYVEKRQICVHQICSHGQRTLLRTRQEYHQIIFDAGLAVSSMRPYCDAGHPMSERDAVADIVAALKKDGYVFIQP